MNNKIYDVIIIGSGPSGLHAAEPLVKTGLNILLVSTSIPNNGLSELVPNKSFVQIREQEENQSEYFLGKNVEITLNKQKEAGTHLTPPRSHMLESTEKIFPATTNSGFKPLIATGEGGLGISWGANCFTYTSEELEKLGLPPEEIQRNYEEISDLIGVSGDQNAETKIAFFNCNTLQSPLSLDTNCKSLLDTYSQSKLKSKNRFGVIAQSFVSILSEPKGNRKANQYHDMDFWSDHGNSVWRPKVLLNELIKNANFDYLPLHKAEKIEKNGEIFKIHCAEIKKRSTLNLEGKKLILACGAFNTAHLLSKSIKSFPTKFKFLCNRNVWAAALNLKMLGKPAQDKRYSLSQLTAYFPKSNTNAVEAVAHIYSYRSLLNFRIASLFPFESTISNLIFRLILNCFTLLNIQYEDDFQLFADRYMETDRNNNLMKFKSEKRNRLLAFISDLKISLFFAKFFCIPLKLDRPIDGASIHYAGTLSKYNFNGVAEVDAFGRLRTLEGIYVADSSSWNYLPAKGLTFTIMAFARNVGKTVLRDIKK